MAAEQPTETELVTRLQALLEANKDKRMVVVGTTCTGKSTFVKSILGAVDMDALVFPLLSRQEADYVDQSPWTPEIGKTMEQLTKERVKVEPGTPVFGTIVLDCDLVIEFKISDDLLRQRTAKRGVNFEDAKNMQNQIEENIRASGIPSTVFRVG